MKIYKDESWNPGIKMEIDSFEETSRELIKKKIDDQADLQKFLETFTDLLTCGRDVKKRLREVPYKDKRRTFNDMITVWIIISERQNILIKKLKTDE
jgi:hypothetical protein